MSPRLRRMLAFGSMAPYDHTSLLTMTQNNFISIDYGTRKSGLAYAVAGFCFAHKTVPTKELVEYLSKWEKLKNSEIIVVGLPLNIDGTESKHSQKVRKFAIELEKHFGNKKIVLHDERLTTAEAKMSGVEDIDAESARLILESYFEESI